MPLSHLNEQGEASMVNIGEKANSARYALAQAVLKMQPETRDSRYLDSCFTKFLFQFLPMDGQFSFMVKSLMI